MSQSNGHSIPLGTEVEVIATDHGNVATPCTGWVEDWMPEGYGVNVPVKSAFSSRDFKARSRETCYFEYAQVRPIIRLLLKDQV